MKRSPPILKEKEPTAVSSLLPKLVNGLAFLILLLSSTQLGLHFWPSSSFVYGARVDYLAPTLYALDVLILVYLVLRLTQKPSLPFPPLLLPLFLVNLLFSLNPLSTAAWLVHFLLYFVFIFSLSPATLKSLKTILPLVMVFQVALGSAQLFLGHTLQGPLYYLGERALNVGSPNVAKAALFGEMTLRAYGTFSHPNVLAGWLTIASLLLLSLTNKSSVKFFTITLTLVGLILAQSRSAALAFFGFVMPLYFFHSLRSRLIYYSLLGATFFILFTASPPSLTDLSVRERLTLQQTSLQIIRHYPLFGTGANASISSYPALAPALRLLQPDHDSFTLFLSWFGLAGLLVILYFLKTFSLPRSLAVSLFPLLSLLLFDHYLLTSPQGLFILLLYLRLLGDIK